MVLEVDAARSEGSAREDIVRVWTGRRREEVDAGELTGAGVMSAEAVGQLPSSVRTRAGGGLRTRMMSAARAKDLMNLDDCGSLLKDAMAVGRQTALVARNSLRPSQRPPPSPLPFPPALLSLNMRAAASLLRSSAAIRSPSVQSLVRALDKTANRISADPSNPASLSSPGPSLSRTDASPSPSLSLLVRTSILD